MRIVEEGEKGGNLGVIMYVYTSFRKHADGWTLTCLSVMALLRASSWSVACSSLRVVAT